MNSHVASLHKTFRKESLSSARGALLYAVAARRDFVLGMVSRRWHIEVSRAKRECPGFPDTVEASYITYWCSLIRQLT